MTLSIDGLVDAYAERCRARVPAFVRGHFTLTETWELQRPTLWRDLAAGAVNSAWAVPFLAARKLAQGFEKLGFPLPARLVEALPSGIKTGYQRQIETLICRDVLEWDDPSVHGGVGDRTEVQRRLRPAVERFSAARALVSDLSASLFTAAIGWFYFRDATLSLNGEAYRLAKREARNQAASHFFLGRRIGSAVYMVFRPEPTRASVATYFVLLAIGLTLTAMICTLLSDPLRRAFRLQERKLLDLVDEIEREIVLATRRR